MHIFILHNKTEAGSYAGALYNLLLQLLKEQSFTIYETDEIKQIHKSGSNSSNTVFLFHSEKKTPSFFTRLKLQNTIRKNSFTYLIQLTDTNPVLVSIPQLIITNNPENITVDTQKDSVIAVCSKANEQKIKSEQENLKAKHFKVIPLSAGHNFQPTSWSQQQAVKMQYTQGREYFLTSAEGKTLTSFTDLLKAFSTFKKWQLSSMKLVVTGKLSFTEREEWREKISTYKFRDDVVLLDKVNSSDIVEIIAGAYAFIHTPTRDNDLLPLVQSTQCETPCISFITESIEEYFSKSSVLIESNDYDQLAEKMILLYKDEALRSRLIAKGKEVSQYYSKEKTIMALADALSVPLH